MAGFVIFDEVTLEPKWDTSSVNEGSQVSKSRNNKIKKTPLHEMEGEMFYMSLDEVRRALRDDYAYLQERHDRSKAARKHQPA